MVFGKRQLGEVVELELYFRAPRDLKPELSENVQHTVHHLRQRVQMATGTRSSPRQRQIVRGGGQLRGTRCLREFLPASLEGGFDLHPHSIDALADPASL